MRLVVLGCSGGYPTPDRSCSGCLVETEECRLWMDAGAGSFARLLRYCSLADLDGVWITHLHPDHWTDLPLAVHALALGAAERDAPLPVYGPTGWVEALGAWARWRLADSPPVFDPRELSEGMLVRRAGTTVEAIAVEHGIETYGLRVRSGGACLAYSADTAPCEALTRLADRADLLLCEAGTMADSSALHLNPEQAGEAATRGQVGHLVLTHLRPEASGEQAVRRARAVYSGRVDVASDGAEFTIQSAAMRD